MIVKSSEIFKINTLLTLDQCITHRRKEGNIQLNI